MFMWPDLSTCLGADPIWLSASAKTGRSGYEKSWLYYCFQLGILSVSPEVSTFIVPLVLAQQARFSVRQSIRPHYVRLRVVPAYALMQIKTFAMRDQSKYKFIVLTIHPESYWTMW